MTPTIKTSKVTTHYITTKNKYVKDIYYASVTKASGLKEIEIAYCETEGDDYKFIPFSVDKLPDLVVITPLKHEYAITFIDEVF